VSLDERTCYPSPPRGVLWTPAFDAAHYGSSGDTDGVLDSVLAVPGPSSLVANGSSEAGVSD
jgi:hypothetical protein